MRPKEFDPQTYAIIGAPMEVHRTLGPKLLERAYHRGLCQEFDERGISYEHEKDVPLLYKGKELGVPFRADFVCGGVILEVKSLPCLGGEEYRQVAHYVISTKSRAGLLLNFGSPSLQVERFELENQFP